MANIESARKRIRKTAKQRQRNRVVTSRMRTAIKKLRQTVEAGEAEAAQELLPRTESIIDATARKGMIHQNAAARTKSRLAKAVASIGA